jgi:hypothetical protein
VRWGKKGAKITNVVLDLIKPILNDCCNKEETTIKCLAKHLMFYIIVYKKPVSNVVFALHSVLFSRSKLLSPCKQATLIHAYIHAYSDIPYINVPFL